MKPAFFEDKVLDKGNLQKAKWNSNKDANSETGFKGKEGEDMPEDNWELLLIAKKNFMNRRIFARSSLKSED